MYQFYWDFQLNLLIGVRKPHEKRFIFFFNFLFFFSVFSLQFSVFLFFYTHAQPLGATVFERIDRGIWLWPALNQNWSHTQAHMVSLAIPRSLSFPNCDKLISFFSYHHRARVLQISICRIIKTHLQMSLIIIEAPVFCQKKKKKNREKPVTAWESGAGPCRIIVLSNREKGRVQVGTLS